MSLATKYEFDNRLDIPFNLAESRLDASLSLPVASLRLSAGQRVSLTWLNLHLIRLVIGTIPRKRNPGFGAAYVGLFGGRSDLIGGPPGQPLAYVGLDIPGGKRLSPWLGQVEISEPDTYTVLLVNNLINAQL